MDETSPVYENFSNKMTAMSGRPKLNVTNMKSPFSGGGSIVPKMAPGSKFIPRPVSYTHLTLPTSPKV